jgi:hypothetical protein
MGRTGSTHNNEKCTRNWSQNLTGKDHLEDLGVDAMSILKCFTEIGRNGLDWINLARGRDKWWALVNTASKLSVS